MAKQLWIALAAALSLLAGVAVFFGSGQGLIGISANASHFPAAVIAAAAALLAGFFLVFVTLAIVEWLEGRRAQAGLDRLLLQARDGAVIEPQELLDALRGTDLHNLAIPYVAGLRHDVAGIDPRRYVGGRPADYFSQAALVEEPLFAAVFRRLPLILTILGSVALLLGLRDGLLAYTEGASSVHLAAGTQAALLACALPLVAALLVMLALPLVLSVRRRQAQGLVRRIDALFPGGDEAFYLRRLIDNTQSNAVEIKCSLRTALDELGKTAKARSDAQADGLREAVTAALQRPMADLSAAIERSQVRQDDAVQRLVGDTLTRFTNAFDTTLGGRMEQLNMVLQATGAAGAGMERSFATALETAGDRQQRQEALLIESLDRHFGAVTAQLGTVGQSLAIEMERHARAVAAQAETLQNGLVALGESVVMQTMQELRTSIAAVRQLYSTVDSLCLSVAPVLNRLIDTQDDLLAALSSESQSARIFAELAGDLKQLSRVNRETVEKHVALASELARATQHLAGGVAQHRPAGLNGSSESVLRALRELRSESDAAARATPQAV